MRDCLHLTKARLSFMVVLSGVVGYWLGARAIDPVSLFWFACGTFLLVGGANALNQVVEREPDARMVRTAQRPIPTGRISVGAATLLATSMSVAGLSLLFLEGGILAGALGLVALFVYVLVYTPMKSRSAWSTLPGAVAGAAPTLMGWSASTGDLAPLAFCLFGIVFFWQFPHTWAIAAAYRDDYERVGYRSLPKRYVGLGTLAATLALISTSLLPVVLGVAGPLYTAGALALGALFLTVAVRFGDGSLRGRATALLVMSLFYLPLILGLAAFDGRIT